MLIVASATLVVSLLLLVVLRRLSVDVRSIRDGVLSDIHRALVQQQFAEGLFSFGDDRRLHEGHDRSTLPGHGCFVVWVWRDGEWKTRGMPKGVQPASPPPYPGAFSGDLAKTWVNYQRR